LEIILESKNINVEKKMSTLLTERGYGCFEGLQDNVIKSKYPDIYEKWKEDENTEIEGAEKIESVVKRIQIFMKNMIDNNHQNVLAVTHSGVLYVLYKYITNTKLGVRPGEISFPNCCSVYLDIYHTNKIIDKLELHIQDQTYVYSCGPTEVVITTT
jgi:broad specificity phosphatase PhoE